MRLIHLVIFLCLVPISFGMEFFPYFDSDIFTAPAVFGKPLRFDSVSLFPSFFGKVQGELNGVDKGFRNNVREVSEERKNDVLEAESSPNKGALAIIESQSESESKYVNVIISEGGFHPSEISVKVNQKILWQNNRERLSAMILGVRGILDMKSEMFSPQQTFSWSFSEPGVYTYVDAIMVGTVGKIVVE